MKWWSVRKPSLQDELEKLWREISTKKQELTKLQREYEALQAKCPHPADRRVIVSDKLRDLVSCDDCGKIIS